MVLFIETSTFAKLLPSYLTDEEYRGLQAYLLQKPNAGDLIKGSGGVRKVRWASEGSGKSGGIIRAIYYWKKSDHEIWMLTLYSKAERASISGHTLKQIAEAIKND
nr:transcriptional regulator [Halomonas sp.]